jgi:endoglycosylceramidase
MWEAVERVPGEYNSTYLDQVTTLINKLGEQGIYTLVDAHQDVFARSICGEGVPDFYAKYDMLSHNCSGLVPDILHLIGACKSMAEYGFRYETNGDPMVEDCQKNNFAGYYTSPESVSAFSNLYNNKDGLQDKFLAYWKSVSQAFSNNKYVIGYDPLNEPGPGDYFTDPNVVLIPGKFDKTLL